MTYSPEEVALHKAAICDLISQGKGLNEICSTKDFPSRQTVYVWLREDETFSDTYARARAEQADLLADEIVAIADTEPDTNKARVRIDARKWKASKLEPRKYGDKVDVVHAGKVDGDVTHHGSIAVSGTADFIARALGAGTPGASTESRPDGPVLPAQVSAEG